MAENEDENKTNHIAIPPTLQRVLPRVITGALSPQNKDALDWGWQGFIAYCAQATIIIVDPVTLQRIQTLRMDGYGEAFIQEGKNVCGTMEEHPTTLRQTGRVLRISKDTVQCILHMYNISPFRAHIVHGPIKWRRTQHYHQLSAPYTLVLASADLNGVIYVWNVYQGDVVATLQDGNRQISELEWLGGQDGSEYLLLALHPPYSVVLWDTRHSTKVWKKSYTETLLTFSLDPFHSNKMAFLCQSCILFVDDFNLSKTPSSNGNRFYISSPNQSPARGSSISGLGDEKERSNTLRKRVRGLVAGELKAKSEETSPSNEILQLMFHQAVHDQLLILYPREVLILDLNINQTVGIISVDRGLSALNKVIISF
ncbi:hypothetical protein Anas_09270 [Armadillidium nasatum]|uniref:WDR11 first beta-propeller domain-containing protein n=1 Tax=Armadillidium nasatum TaxID=96803 RepID=A0A5N5SMB2_9CRUS|nr:hypothetical protein Anas_09270 [Armadillidium nasatum]